MYRNIIVDKRGGALVITLNRPEARNAMSVALQQEITEALDELEADPDLRAGIIANTGPVFCAGADLKEISEGVWDTPHAPDGTDYGFAGATKRYIEKPLIAAVNGKAVGGGLELVMACDLVVASDDAIFWFPEPRRGLTAAGGGSLLRAGQQLTVKRANQLLLLAEPIDAQEALDWGLINFVVPGDDVLDKALDMAGKIALGAPLAIQYTKRTVYETMGYPPVYPNEGWDLLEKYERFTVESRDAHEGSTAFVEKRPPRWEGR